MPSRLDSVKVDVNGDVHVIDWATRDELLGWLEGVPGGGRAIIRFRAVGATRPADLSAEEQGAVLLAIEQWMHSRGNEGFSPGLVGLRRALADACRSSSDA